MSIYSSWAEGTRAAHENEARANAICATTDDYKEAVTAFREKKSRFQRKMKKVTAWFNNKILLYKYYGRDWPGENRTG